ncbi:Transporter of the ATP-binding cassette (ABC) [Neocucurbitaria cava]|uniref:Transporter of the ATP-binding cassette (ABC) n=1 Tax=Neocucurbitaria cava TaxID=798079 RepID=A0A9W8Y643_9PLEO|nr:Transporter of the ATP-binding cassette (ABC) [Neocucurbitaria cava]
MFAHCKGPIWGRDDFSRCFEQDHLQTLFPLIVCGFSVGYLLIQLYFAAKKTSYYHTYSVLDDPRDVWSFRSPHYDGDATDSDSEDEFDRNEEAALRPSISHKSMSIVAADKPRGQVTVVVLEEAAVLAQLGVHIAIFMTNAWGRHGRIAAIANIAVWTYIAALASLRLLFSSTSKWSFPGLWYHTAFIYGFQWLFTVLLFRSAIIHPRSDVHQKLMISQFALVSLLFLIALCSRKGNKTVELEYEGDIAPAREPTASVLSLATFSWVDSIVWTGYKKTYELSDVWNLPPKDKAAAVIANYRQVKKTSSLAFHLLKHFKRGLIIQAGWAAMSGFLTFAPTLLLKAILEYVETPERTPVNAAWFYVILLFVSGTLSALADGQALWIGRKICIRLRAVIIGEIYAKALKRRAAAGTDKVLGEEKKKQEQEEEPKGLKRMMTFGKKKKKALESPKQEDAPKPESDAQVTTGAIINLMAVDAFKVSEICAYLHFLWANTPVQVVVAVYLLYRILGYSSIAGIGMMVVLLPINMYVAKQFAKIQKLILAATDARIHTTNEVLTNIRIIKFFAWEQRFIGLVNEKRYIELKNLRRRYILWAVAATIWSGSPVLITFLSFFVYTNVEHKALIPSVAFTALSLFQILRIPLDQLADMIAHVQESRVSVDRIEEYLSEPETDKYSQLVTRKKDDDGQPIIGFEDGTFSWGGKDMTNQAAADAFKLMELNLKFAVGKLNVVVGPTGSGKTSLLMGLLGEMTKLKGDVYLPGGGSREDLRPDPETGLTESVAYCAQQAWLVNGTIKDNIIFASDFDQKRYDEVIVACSLQRDLEILDGGDETIVGEKGVTLSGGQKQRISLARALYSKARHVLLDDVLSAVDSHTAKWIFDYALYGQLMANRTCILVTHNVSLCLPHAEFVVALENGKVAAQGTAAEVISSGKLTEDLTKSRPASRGASKPPSRVPSDVGGEEADGEVSHANGNGNPKGKLIDPKDSKKKTPATNSQEETKAEGGVKLSIILMYLKAMGPWYYWVGATIAFVAAQISSVSTNLWIRTWANAYADKGYAVAGHNNRTPITHAPTLSGMGTCLNSGTCSWNIPFFAKPEQQVYSYNYMQTSFHDGNNDVDSAYFLGVYAILGLIFMLITFLREGFLFGGSLAASRRVHERLIQKVTHAKFRFFDQTPLGQLMNRFSKDIEAVDQEVAPVAIGVVHCLASIVTIVILISVITPAFLIAASVISVLYFLIGRFYINSSRDLKRLESVHRSPLYQQFGETLTGMTTIRAYGDERRFIRENLTKINTQHRPFIYLWAANRWLALRVDVVGAMVAFFAGTFVVLSVGRIDAGAAGLALTYAVTFTENVLWFVRLYSANEQNMNSVERVKEYLDVDQEAPPVIPENRPASNWPSKGSVEFINYSTRYRTDFDLVLKNLTFKILPGEKVGVVGRTGAGKSSMALALFRALEAETGKILVDDVDIGLIGLQDLRENIVMVPQDPTLFTGTIRSNLDPFSVFTDEEIFTALREVHLISPTSQPTSGTGTPTGVSTPPRAIEIPNPTTGAVTADVNASYSASTVNPSSILANRDWERGETQDDTILVMPNGNIATDEEAARAAMQADNKNPFRNLNSPVTESGSNLSQGQRQLLCLARALLKSPKVLLMDEATASIDYATDAKIQETIRLIKNTTITIAHRLQTIIDYDKVLVLDKGSVLEYGDPYDLIRKDGGEFRSMCETSGELDALTGTARAAHQGRKDAAKAGSSE